VKPIPLKTRVGPDLDGREVVFVTLNSSGLEAKLFEDDWNHLVELGADTGWILSKARRNYFYLRVRPRGSPNNVSTIIARIITGAQSDQQVRHLGDHLDLRRDHLSVRDISRKNRQENRHNSP